MRERTRKVKRRRITPTVHHLEAENDPPMGSDAKLRRILSKLDPKEREALDRFYYLQQTAGQISTELHIDAEKLRKLKSRVKVAYFATRKTN
jgi:DNA-directed RNA polymerase specialized sigma24 family protein